jgi:hypothetical protein
VYAVPESLVNHGVEIGQFVDIGERWVVAAQLFVHLFHQLQPNAHNNGRSGPEPQLSHWLTVSVALVCCCGEKEESVTDLGLDCGVQCEQVEAPLYRHEE